MSETISTVVRVNKGKMEGLAGEEEMGCYLVSQSRARAHPLTSKASGGY